MKRKLPLKKKLRVYIGDTIHRKKALAPQIDEGFRILLYHSITDSLIKNEWEENTIHKKLFATQMKYLVENKYNIVSCKKAVGYLIEKAKIPNKTIAIAFDDGYRNNYINAFPVLKEHNICATIFLTMDFLRDYSGNTDYLNRVEILNIKRSGLIDFGCHGLTHKMLSMLSGEELDREIAAAKEKLEYLTESEIELFAYPFGHCKSYNSKVIERIKLAGFTSAFTTIFGLNNLRRNRFLLRRNRISWLDELDEFEKHLSGAYDFCSLFECFRSKRYC